MTRRGLSALLLTIFTVALTGCSDDGGVAAPSPASPIPLPTSPAATSPEQFASSLALSTYEGYWRLSEQAEAAPQAKDWRPELAKVMADPALTDYANEIANLASIPAHAVGAYRRSPKVTAVSLAEPPRVVVTDCLDATDEHLISDKPAEAGRNLDNPDQPRRYEFEAQIVRYRDSDRWLVQLVQARLEKRC